MRLARLALGLLILSAAHAARADGDWYDSTNALRTGPSVDVGYSWGGNDLNRADLVAGHNIKGIYYAGEGLSVDGGMVELFGDRGLGFKQELGVWLQLPLTTSGWSGQPDNSSDSLTFDHSFANFLAFYHWDEMALGGGVAYQTHAIVADGKAGSATLTDFENAHGLILMYQYRGLSLRYTRVKYHVKHDASVPSVDGSNLGIYLTIQFF